MNKVCFTGRKAGSIGVTYPMVAEVLNDPYEDLEACRTELYNIGYEHVTKLRAFPIDRRLLPYKVLLNGQIIDIVYFNANHSADYVKNTLIEHDGFEPNIEVEPEGWE